MVENMKTVKIVTGHTWVPSHRVGKSEAEKAGVSNFSKFCARVGIVVLPGYYVERSGYQVDLPVQLYPYKITVNPTDGYSCTE